MQSDTYNTPKYKQMLIDFILFNNLIISYIIYPSINFDFISTTHLLYGTSFYDFNFLVQCIIECYKKIK